MARGILFGLVLCLFTLPLLAGNRADLNADQTINSADLVLMANLQAGNMDIGPYSLNNVVVVAPQGGDFTDPAAAADWVTSQSPSSTKRFVILVTPGTYELSRQVSMPAYTTLKGYGATNTVLHWSGTTDSSWQYGIYVYDGIGVEIRDLAIDYGMVGQNTSSTHVGLYVGVKDQLVFSGLDIRMESTANSALRYGAFVVGKSPGSFMRFHNCHVSSSCLPGQGNAQALHFQPDPVTLTDVVLELDSCQLEAVSASSQTHTVQIAGPVSALVKNSDLEVSGSTGQFVLSLGAADSSLHVFGSRVKAMGTSSYYCWAAASGTARFQGCLLKGIANVPAKLFSCCDVDLNPLS